MKDCHTARFLEEGITQCFSEAMAKLLLAVQILINNAAYHPWMKDFHTARFLQDIITQWFSEVMVKLLLAAAIRMDNAAFHPWMKDCHTARFLEEGITQCFSEAMAKLLLAVQILMNNATFHPWMKDFHTARFLQEIATQCSLDCDGQAVACGSNLHGKCIIPSLRSWRNWLPFGSASPSVRYVCDFTFLPLPGKDRVVQVDFLLEDDAGVILTCIGLDGLELLRLKAQKSERTVDVCSRMARELNTNTQNLRIVLPDARLLGTICKANPFATLSDVISV